MNHEKHNAAYCPGCGRAEYAGITHVCPPLSPPLVVTRPQTWTASSVPVFVTEANIG